MLDFRSLQMAGAWLAGASDAAKFRPTDAFERVASIQRFEYTYELCVKSLRCQRETMSDSPAEIDAPGYRDMIRAAAVKGLVTNETAWFAYRELRNIKSHVYDPAKARRVFVELPQFLLNALLTRSLEANA